MEDELQCKYREKIKYKKNIGGLSVQLKSCLNVLIYSVLLHKMNITFRNRLYAVSKRPNEKFFNLGKQSDKRNFNDRAKQSKYVTDNFSSYFLTKGEDILLCYEFDQCIPNFTDCSSINTELKCFTKLDQDPISSMEN